MTPEEWSYVLSFFDVAISLGILVMLVFAFVRGDIVSSTTVEKIVMATVDAILRELRDSGRL